jgi:hypothetical protein
MPKKIRCTGGLFSSSRSLLLHKISIVYDRHGEPAMTTKKAHRKSRKQLVKATKARSGIRSDTDRIEYALARVALEDDFGQKLIARKGRVPRDIDLEF